jgi:hypothetical protein
MPSTILAPSLQLQTPVYEIGFPSRWLQNQTTQVCIAPYHSLPAAHLLASLATVTRHHYHSLVNLKRVHHITSNISIQVRRQRIVRREVLSMGVQEQAGRLQHLRRLQATNDLPGEMCRLKERICCIQLACSAEKA